MIIGGFEIVWFGIVLYSLWVVMLDELKVILLFVKGGLIYSYIVE